jgi:hypothetical protein
VKKVKAANSKNHSPRAVIFKPQKANGNAKRCHLLFGVVMQLFLGKSPTGYRFLNAVPPSSFFASP